MVQTPVKSTVLKPDKLQTHPNCTWEQFKLIQKELEDSPRSRLFYFQETIEILTVSRYHEIIKKIIAILLEVFLLDHDIEATPTGQMDREAEGEASAQPDESYEIGDYKLLIEVIVTSGTITKLQLYKSLAIQEVWFWKDGVVKLYHLIEREYQQVERSQIPDLATIDMAIFAKCILMGETSRLEAIDALRAAHPH
jgi:Uma2 family endonuclease